MDYWLATKVIEAERMLNDTQTSSFPQTKKEFKSKFIKKLENIIRHTVKKKNSGLKSIEEIEKSLKEQIFKGLNRG